MDNVLLAINMNMSMLSVQDIHDHMSKYVSIPQSWRSKNYGFEFVECINAVVQKEVMSDLRNASYHTLITDESTDVSVTKMLILYAKFRPCNEPMHRTIFAGILQLTACDSTAITAAIKDFYAVNDIDLQKMVMFTSDGASVMLGKNNGVAALLRRDVPHLVEQHCVAHREDLGIDDACKHVSLMKDIETLLRTVYTLFCRSSVKKAAFAELAEVLECESVAFKPLNEVRWLSRHFALRALMRNITVLLEYCKEQAEEHNDPVCKYCYRQLTNPQVRAALIVFDDVVRELAELSKLLQRSNLTPIEAFQFVKARISKLRLQYLGDIAHWSEEVCEFMQSNPDIDMAAILRFVERLCLHLDSRFPDNELKEWNIFEVAALANVTSFNFGETAIANLIAKYQHVFEDSEEACKSCIVQYRDFRCLVSEKIKSGLIQTFHDVVQFALQDGQFELIARLLDICATFQASSADCERGFSLMNAVKTKSRNRLQTDHLDMLMRIKFHQSSGAQIDLHKVYLHWSAQKDRREKL